MHNAQYIGKKCTMHCTMSNTSVYWQEVYNAHCTMISVSGTRYTLHVAHCTLRCSQFHQPTCFQVRRRSSNTSVHWQEMHNARCNTIGTRYTLHNALSHQILSNPDGLRFELRQGASSQYQSRYKFLS